MFFIFTKYSRNKTIKILLKNIFLLFGEKFIQRIEIFFDIKSTNFSTYMAHEEHG